LKKAEKGEACSAVERYFESLRQRRDGSSGRIEINYTNIGGEYTNSGVKRRVVDREKAKKTKE